MLFHVIFFVYEYEVQFLKRTAIIVFQAVIFILRKNIDIETITPLRENTHIHTQRDRFITSPRSRYGRSVLYSDHAVEEAVSKLYMAISKTWPFFPVDILSYVTT